MSSRSLPHFVFLVHIFHGDEHLELVFETLSSLDESPSRYLPIWTHLLEIEYQLLIVLLDVPQPRHATHKPDFMLNNLNPFLHFSFLFSHDLCHFSL